MTDKEVLQKAIEEVNSNVYIQVKVVTSGVLQVNDNWKIVKELEKLGFQNKDGITQDDEDVSWTILEINKGFIFKDDEG
jgi:hypothetical protein